MKSFTNACSLNEKNNLYLNNIILSPNVFQWYIWSSLLWTKKLSETEKYSIFENSQGKENAQKIYFYWGNFSVQAALYKIYFYVLGKNIIWTLLCHVLDTSFMVRQVLIQPMSSSGNF